MAYHITSITNGSPTSIAITNPHNEGDSRLILNGETYEPERPILINKITASGSVNYQQAAPVAVNIYTLADNFCFWDNGSDAANGVGQKSGPNLNYYNGTAGNLAISIESNGTLAFNRA